MGKSWLVKKKSSRFTMNDEFVIFITGKIKDKRSGTAVYKQLNGFQYRELKRMIRRDTDLLSNCICRDDETPDYDALYINPHVFDTSYGSNEGLCAKIKNWRYEQAIYDMIDDPNTRIVSAHKSASKKHKK